MRAVLKGFVIENGDWPEPKSSESSEQLIFSGTLQDLFVKVIGQFCSKLAVRPSFSRQGYR